MSGKRGGAQAPPLGDYAMVGDCHGAALISRKGSIDWCCMPRFDAGSCFGRLLDWSKGGCCSLLLDGRECRGTASYLEDTMVVQTTIEAGGATLRLLDFFAMPAREGLPSRHELVRIVQCERGEVEAAFHVAPCFDYGEVRPWLRRAGMQTFTAIGGDDGLVLWSDGEIAVHEGAVRASRRLAVDEQLCLVMRFARPHELDAPGDAELDPQSVQERLDRTTAWWQRWRRRLTHAGPELGPAVRSGLTLKALTYAPTGAIVAAATTSLPEQIGGERNWDYRFSWIRDSTLAAHSLVELGCEREAERFRHFIVRSSAGHADDLQILFGVGGERRVGEQQLELDGYRGSRPVRVGNSAARQLQLDALGEILDLGWRWHLRGRSPDDDEWRFLAELVETAIRSWREPDRGIWEWRTGPRHFVHSKACCWTAVDRGLRLAEECARRVPVRRWTKAREEIRRAVERRGYDRERGVFTQCFDEPQMDAALLLLPVVGFVEFDDERMVRTADAIREDLGEEGFVRRYPAETDGLPGREGAFVACSFWLAECYARQGRGEDARAVFDRTMAAASPVGLFSEEVDPQSGELLGNYPQALTHLAHVSAAVAIADLEQAPLAEFDPQRRG